MKYYIWILGCQFNYADGEKLKAILESYGLEESSEKEADLVIVLSCAVRQKPIDRILGKFNRWQKDRKYILAGCVLPEDKPVLEKKFDLVLANQEIFSLPDFFPALGIETVQSLRPERTLESHIGYVIISQGCNNFCSYCAVPYTRGREISRSEEEVLEEIKDLLSKGCKEIMLLGQNVNSYNPSKEALKDDSPFARLLEKVNTLPGEFTFTFLSPHPKDMSSDLIATLAKLEKFDRNLHLPVQSGDNEVLKRMNRHYKAEEILQLVQKIRQAMPDINLTTDFIVGFPGESAAQFENSVQLAQKAGFSKAYVSQYSERPGTLSAKKYADDVSSEEKKRRWLILDGLLNKKN